MKLVHIYVNFPGNTEEALRYYETVFHTRIAMLMRYGETPWIPNVPEAAKGKIMHGQIPLTESVHLMASDANCGFGPPVTAGNNFQISIVANDKAEADRVFAALGSGGKIAMPLANAPWGPYFGTVIDKFGIQWMVSLEKPA